MVGPSVMPPEQWIKLVVDRADGTPVFHLGSGVQAYSEHFGTSQLDDRVSAKWLARLAMNYDLAELPVAQPLYVRPSQAEVKFGKAPDHDPLAGLD